MPKLTKEDLDKIEAWCNGHSDHPKFEVSMDELLRLARLGLWAEDHKEVLDALLDKEAMHQSNLWAPEAVAALSLWPKK